MIIIMTQNTEILINILLLLLRCNSCKSLQPKEINILVGILCVFKIIIIPIIIVIIIITIIKKMTEKKRKKIDMVRTT